MPPPISASPGAVPPPISASPGGAPPAVSGASTLSPVPFTADLDGAWDDTTIIHHSSERSFLNEFAPPGLSGSDPIAGTTAVLNTTASVINSTASAINTTASAVCQMFSSNSTYCHPSAGPAQDS